MVHVTNAYYPIASPNSWGFEFNLQTGEKIERKWYTAYSITSRSQILRKQLITIFTASSTAEVQHYPQWLCCALHGFHHTTGKSLTANTWLPQNPQKETLIKY